MIPARAAQIIANPADPHQPFADLVLPLDMRIKVGSFLSPYSLINI